MKEVFHQVDGYFVDYEDVCEALLAPATLAAT